MYQKLKKNGYGNGTFIVTAITIAIVMSLTAIEANASLSFYDNFEDGDYTGWPTSGSGSFGVVVYNESNMARAIQTGRGSSAFSHDFIYANDSILSFDMQVNGTVRVDYASYVAHGGGYVNVSFLNNFNVSIGSASLQYSTNPGSIDPAYRIDSEMHHYEALMSEWAALAGLDNTENISTLKLSFTAWAERTTEAHYQSTGTVWFDNVSVSSVPEPTTLCMLGLGSLTLLMKRRVG